MIIDLYTIHPKGNSKLNLILLVLLSSENYLISLVLFSSENDLISLVLLSSENYFYLFLFDSFIEKQNKN